MNNQELTLINSLNEASTNLPNVTDLSEEALLALLGVAPVLTQWLTGAEGEAVSRARDGVRFDGYSLKEGSRRKIVDEEGAIAALQAVDPALVPLCQNTRLASIKELQTRLGRNRFEDIFAPFLEMRSWYNLVEDTPRA